MAICKDCNGEMKSKAIKSCTVTHIDIGNKVYKRDTSYFDDNERCHDCGIENKTGNIHHYRCDMERCPICGGQLISCECED